MNFTDCGVDKKFQFLCMATRGAPSPTTSTEQSMLSLSVSTLALHIIVCPNSLSISGTGTRWSLFSKNYIPCHFFVVVKISNKCGAPEHWE